MKADSSMKDDFHLFLLRLEQPWIKRLSVNSKFASLALRLLIPFSSTYLCKTGFSALVLIKTKQRNLTKTEPKINQLVLNMQNLRCLISTYSYFIIFFDKKFNILLSTFKNCLLESK
nr:unnamed protein product [Callosobruchus analis]